MTTPDPATVLIVDDEPAIADGHAARLADHHDVITAYDGQAALEALDDSIDVVLLDRRMPGLSGDEVLDRIEASDLRCRVAMLTGVEPDVDIVSMGFDDYLRKPVTTSQLLEAIDRLCRRSTYDEKLRQYFALASKRAILETEQPAEALAESEEYTDLLRDIDRLERELDQVLAELPPEDGYATAIGRDSRADAGAN